MDSWKFMEPANLVSLSMFMISVVSVTTLQGPFFSCIRPEFFYSKFFFFILSSVSKYYLFRWKKIIYFLGSVCVILSDIVKSDCPILIFREIMKYLKVWYRLLVNLLVLLFVLEILKKKKKVTLKMTSQLVIFWCFLLNKKKSSENDQSSFFFFFFVFFSRPNYWHSLVVLFLVTRLKSL